MPMVIRCIIIVIIVIVFLLARCRLVWGSWRLVLGEGGQLGRCVGHRATWVAFWGLWGFWAWVPMVVVFGGG